MPNWGRPRDVLFDEPAAGAAIESVAAFRFVLASSWASERSAADRALASWEGLSADAFGAALGARQAETDQASSDLLALQRAIEDAADDARIEQGRVDRRQAQWDVERRAEIAAQLELEDAEEPQTEQVFVEPAQ